MRFLLVLVTAFAALLASCGDSEGFQTEAVETAEADYNFVIPAGAGEAFDAGTPLEILPARLDVSIGEVIEIVNDDDRGHLIGPFFVGAGETLRQTFASAGEYIGDCSVHPSGQIVMVVS